MPIPHLQLKDPAASHAPPVSGMNSVLGETTPQRVPRPRGQGPHRSVWVLWVIILLYGVSALLLVRGAHQTRSALEGLIRAVERGDTGAATLHARNAHAHIVQLGAFAVPWRPFGVVPTIGALIRLQEHAEELLGTVEDLLALPWASSLFLDTPADTPLQMFLDSETTLASLTVSRRRALFAEGIQMGTHITNLTKQTDAFENALDALPENFFGARFHADVATLTERVWRIHRAYTALRPMIELAPLILGYGTEKRYLFFFANNTELRPSLGFFGFYGTVTVRDGGMVSLEADDVYGLDFAARDAVLEKAPAPIARYLGTEKWFLRDANWSPDFSVAAADAMRLYAAERAVLGHAPQRLDGVIALTPTLAEDLLRLIGPVTVDDLTFTPENLVSLLEYQVEYGYAESGIPEKARKGIVLKLFQEVLHRLETLPASQWGAVLALLERNLAEKQLVGYAVNAKVQGALEEWRFAGRVSAASSSADALLVVDANLGSLKTDAVMRRALAYSVTEDADGNFIAHARMTYTNTGGFTLFTTRYRTYTRFFVPEGSILIRAEGHLQNDRLLNPSGALGTVDEDYAFGRTVFGMFTAVEPGETRALTITYRLPERIRDALATGSYTLLVEKQSGAQSMPLTLDVRFDKKVQRARPAEVMEAWGDTRYALDTVLTRDLDVTVGF